MKPLVGRATKYTPQRKGSVGTKMFDSFRVFHVIVVHKTRHFLRPPEWTVGFEKKDSIRECILIVVPKVPYTLGCHPFPAIVSSWKWKVSPTNPQNKWCFFWSLGRGTTQPILFPCNLLYGWAHNSSSIPAVWMEWRDLLEASPSGSQTVRIDVRTEGGPRGRKPA